MKEIQLKQKIDVYKNKTQIIFDDTLKKFIFNLKEVHSKILDSTKFFGEINNFSALEEIQLIIRDWIIQNQRLLNLETKRKIQKNPKSMPDFFAIFICLLVDLSMCNSWEDVNNQYLYYDKFKINLDLSLDISNNTFMNETLNDDADEIMCVCLCNHSCIMCNMSKISNEKITLWIACDCAVKTTIITEKEYKKKIRELRPRNKEIQAKKLKKELHEINKIKKKFIKELKKKLVFIEEQQQFKEQQIIKRQKYIEEQQRFKKQQIIKRQKYIEEQQRFKEQQIIKQKQLSEEREKFREQQIIKQKQLSEEQERFREQQKIKYRFKPDETCWKSFF